GKFHDVSSRALPCLCRGRLETALRIDRTNTRNFLNNRDSWLPPPLRLVPDVKKFDTTARPSSRFPPRLDVRRLQLSSSWHQAHARPRQSILHSARNPPHRRHSPPPRAP